VLTDIRCCNDNIDDVKCDLVNNTRLGAKVAINDADVSPLPMIVALSMIIKLSVISDTSPSSSNAMFDTLLFTKKADEVLMHRMITIDVNHLLH
jgi:hypothetical protein